MNNSDKLGGAVPTEWGACVACQRNSGWTTLQKQVCPCRAWGSWESAGEPFTLHVQAVVHWGGILSFRKQAWLCLCTAEHKQSRVPFRGVDGVGPQNQTYCLDSLKCSAACGVTQLHHPSPDGKKAILSCPLITVAFLPQS